MVKIRHLKNCRLEDDVYEKYDNQEIIQVIVNNVIVFEFDVIDNRENGYSVVITKDTIIKEIEV